MAESSTPSKLRATPIPNGIYDWLRYMPCIEPFEAKTLSSTHHGVLLADTEINYGYGIFGVPGRHLSSIPENALDDDIELECWNFVAITKISYSRTNPVSDTILQVGNLVAGTFEESLEGYN